MIFFAFSLESSSPRPRMRKMPAAVMVTRPASHVKLTMRVKIAWIAGARSEVESPSTPALDCTRASPAPIPPPPNTAAEASVVSSPRLRPMQRIRRKTISLYCSRKLPPPLPFPRPMRPSAKTLLLAAKLPAVLITEPVNVRYLTGFKGDSASVLALPSGFILFADSLEYEAARSQKRKGVRLQTKERGFPEKMATVKQCGF